METVVESVTFGFIISGLLSGVIFGFILQRGRFCMNSAFRDTIFIKDFTYFHAYLLALTVMLIGSQALQDLDIIHMKAQSFFPLANIIGGYIFGLGIVLAGGCGSGITYRVGEGQLASWVAVLGFFFDKSMRNFSKQICPLTACVMLIVWLFVCCFMSVVALV